MMNSVSDFGRDGYILLRSLLKEPALSLNYGYARKVAAVGAMQEDDMVEGAQCLYGDVAMEGLLVEVLPDVERHSGLRLFPTYSYLRMYTGGTSLQKHTDHPSCEISLTLCLGFEAAAPWPICIESPRGTVSISLAGGDALLYRGIECPHWREPLDGSHVVQVFLHYVDQNGPYAKWKFDKRPSLTRFSSPVSLARPYLHSYRQPPSPNERHLTRL